MKVLMGVKANFSISEDFIRTFDKGTHSFEIWSSNGLDFVFCSTYSEQDLRRRIVSFYPDAEFYEPLQPDFYVEFAVRMRLKDPYLPIRSETTVDPLNLALTSLIGKNAIFQVVFEPAPGTISKRILEYSKSLTRGKVIGWFNPKVVSPSNIELSIANELAEKSKVPLYYTELRIISDSEVDLGWLKVLSKWRQYLEIKKVRNKRKFLKEVMERVIKDKRSVFSAKELSIFVHIPKLSYPIFK